MEVLNTASPKASPRAPNPRPRNDDPSSRTSSASGPLTSTHSPLRLPSLDDQLSAEDGVHHSPSQQPAEEGGVSAARGERRLHHPFGVRVERNEVGHRAGLHRPPVTGG